MEGDQMSVDVPNKRDPGGEMEMSVALSTLNLKGDGVEPRAGTLIAGRTSAETTNTINSTVEGRKYLTNSEEQPPGPSHRGSGFPLIDINKSHAAGFGVLDRPLNVTHAHSYLDAVKNEFNDRPHVYKQFLDIMAEFRNRLVDAPNLIQRVLHLFHGHPALIQGFNAFLPLGYRLECSLDPQNEERVTVTTPTGTTTQGTSKRGLSSLSVQHDARYGPCATGECAISAHGWNVVPSLSDPRLSAFGKAIEPAVQFLDKVKRQCDPGTYRRFLEILSRSHKNPDSTDQDVVTRQIERILKDAPELLADFRNFKPDRS